jgi:hypothetical protein
MFLLALGVADGEQDFLVLGADAFTCKAVTLDTFGTECDYLEPRGGFVLGVNHVRESEGLGALLTEEQAVKVGDDEQATRCARSTRSSHRCRSGFIRLAAVDGQQ